MESREVNTYVHVVQTLLRDYVHAHYMRCACLGVEHQYTARVYNHVAAVGLCYSVYVCLSTLASPSPMILPPVSGKELHRDTERAVTELSLYIFQFRSYGSGSCSSS